MSKESRHRRRSKTGRQHDQVMERKASSAEASGIARTPAVPPPVAKCPAELELERLTIAARAKDPTHYNFCNLQSLTFTVTSKSVKKPFSPVVIDRRKVGDPVATSAQYYKSELSYHDVVMEVLSTARDETETKDGKKEFTEGKVPIHIQAQAVNGPTHAGFTPHHPETRITGENQLAVAPGGGTANDDLVVPNTSILNTRTWGRFWPFRRGQYTYYVVDGRACGNAQPGQTSRSYLSAQIIVLPLEEYVLTLGLGAKYSYKREREHSFKDGSDSLSYTTEHRDHIDSQKLEVKKDGSFEYTESETHKDRTIGVRAFRSQSVKMKDITADPELENAKSGHQVPKISFKRNIAGQEVETDVGEFINKILTIEEIAHKLSSLLEDVKIGWSISTSYACFDGNLSLAWGRDWPEQYHEVDRVYYIDQFVRLSGSCSLFKGTVEGMCGIDVNPWWLPGSIVGKAFLTIEGSISADGSGTKKWQHGIAPHFFAATAAGSDLLLAINISASIEAKLGVTAGGTVMGVGISATAAISGKLTWTGQGGMSLRDGPSLTTTLKSEPIQATLSVTRIGGDDPGTYQTEPFIICHLPEGWKDRPVFGG